MYWWGEGMGEGWRLLARLGESSLSLVTREGLIVKSLFFWIGFCMIFLRAWCSLRYPIYSARLKRRSHPQQATLSAPSSLPLPEPNPQKIHTVRDLLHHHHQQVSAPSPSLLQAHACRSSVTGGSINLNVVFGWNVVIKYPLPIQNKNAKYSTKESILHARCQVSSPSSYPSPSLTKTSKRHNRRRIHRRPTRSSQYHGHLSPLPFLALTTHSLTHPPADPRAPPPSPHRIHNVRSLHHVRSLPLPLLPSQICTDHPRIGSKPTSRRLR
jgi:hypothetical protein